MNCPVCDDMRLKEVEIDGITIDICPQCKGVWLDRGELDKLMNGVREIRPQFDEWHREHDRHDDWEHHGWNHGHKRKKKKNFLDIMGDLFD